METPSCAQCENLPLFQCADCLGPFCSECSRTVWDLSEGEVDLCWDCWRQREADAMKRWTEGLADQKSKRAAAVTPGGDSDVGPPVKP